ncbi:uncharacterized protein LOC110428887 [Herrania umbratica]|uniref:Uncharacterized protein LOC110428887 n=1 Tax=Herrania umbratica TaxID=108875 RepID=A0A6J1BN05_9ROSI|nr:uncharacterized protein LOC110428887 [Herrania umbratica]
MTHMDPSDPGSTPSIARIYDYVLGGSANFQVDREAAQVLLDAFPGERDYAWINRAFLRRAVTELCALGVDQFLDLGSGIPTVGNVHEIAHRVNPEARVAYVDIDPVAVHHARGLLDGDPRVTATEADVRDPRSVLDAPGVRGLLDLDRPVAVLVVALLDILEVDDAGALVAAYRDACAPGSALVVTNGCQMAATDAELEAFRAVLARTPTPTMTMRSADEVAALFAGYTLLEPGVVPSAAWRPDVPVTAEQAAGSNSWGAVGLRA